METLFIGKNLIFLPETDSTNSYATGLLKNVNPPEGTVVHAAFQTAGKGQRGNAWMSQPLSNLTASIILKPAFLNIKNHFFLYQIAALACFDTLTYLFDKRQYDIKIKWPNDILVNGRKICGMLIENSVVGAEMRSSVVGIGINLNQHDFGKLENVTSYKILTGEDIASKSVLAILCAQFEKHYLALKQQKLEMISELYLSRLFALDSRRAFEIDSSVQHLVVKGVNNTGLLHLEDDHGAVIEADVKQIRWIF